MYIINRNNYFSQNLIKHLKDKTMEKLGTVKSPSINDEQCLQKCFKSEFYLDLLKAAQYNTGDYFRSVYDVLHNSFNVVELALYARELEDGELVLLSSYGSKKHPVYFSELLLNDLGYDTLKDGNSIMIDGHHQLREYFKVKNLKGNTNKKLILSPIEITKNSNNIINFQYALCLIFENLQDREIVSYYLDEIRLTVGSLYFFVIQQKKLQFREELVKKAAISHDLNSCLHRGLILIRDFLNIDAGSIFLYDEKSRLLRAHATSGFEGSRHLEDVIYKSNDNSDTWKVFEKGEIIGYKNISTKRQKGRFAESISGERKSFIALPITHPRTDDDTKRKRKIGVIRLLNKYRINNGDKCLIYFTFEDVLLLEFACDLLSVIVHQMKSRERRIEFFEKILHGTYTNIKAVRLHIDILENRGRINAYIPDPLKYCIPNSLFFLDDIRAQIDRLSMPDPAKFKIEKVRIAGAVLSKIVAYIEELVKTEDIIPEVTNLKKDYFYDLPPVKGDLESLMTVFRNLAENSIKYRKNNTNKLIVELTYRILDNYVEILFSDYGMGIPLEDREFIFEEGYRSENAIRRQPSGTGLGLSHSKDLMKLMGGMLELDNDTDRTTFVIRIEKWERNI